MSQSPLNFRHIYQNKTKTLSHKVLFTYTNHNMTIKERTRHNMKKKKQGKIYVHRYKHNPWLLLIITFKILAIKKKRKNLPICCRGYSGLQIFGLHSNFRALLGFSLMVADTRACSMSSLWVFPPRLLALSTVIFWHVWLLYHACGPFLVISKVCICVWVVLAM